tara:strand:- start:994 stop:1506 length:513 start_codon:yes stop_codon:yes gene_type:complete
MAYEAFVVRMKDGSIRAVGNRWAIVFFVRDSIVVVIVIAGIENTIIVIIESVDGLKYTGCTGVRSEFNAQRVTTHWNIQKTLHAHTVKTAAQMPRTLCFVGVDLRATVDAAVVIANEDSFTIRAIEAKVCVAHTATLTISYLDGQIPLVGYPNGVAILIALLEDAINGHA